MLFVIHEVLVVSIGECLDIINFLVARDGPILRHLCLGNIPDIHYTCIILIIILPYEKYYIGAVIHCIIYRVLNVKF